MSTEPAQDDRPAAQDNRDRTGDGAGTSTPANDQNNATYSAESLNSTDSSRRTDIRTTDEHYSWRQVAAACHVQPGR